ncbi:hypothetical protein DFH11DRAFT_1607229 [Phellopilus nigrolimitatus]|nr:hypothetical protein DFH11DRAFT_1607229 [Phellopilus nigrolimitatus]
MAPLSRLSNALSTFVLLVSTCLAEKIALRGGLQERKLSLEPGPVDQYRFLPPVQAPHGGPEDELELLDICLLASVDGKFRALNRSSGQVLWSMEATSSSVPAALGPLVRTQHVDHNDDGEPNELYIIEPQSGDIYVLPSSDAPLQRLPFSMAQLVDMSPFGFSGDDEHRVFVGKKETSLLLIELETGRLKGTVNSECPWDPFGDLDYEQSKVDLDLDELDGTKPSKNKPVSTEVLIGRTDYHVSIHTRPRSPFDPKPPVQNLTFSTYGPNNQDHAIQGTYRRTPDDTYIQSMPNGEIMSFRTSTSEWSESRPLWGITFKNPIVAVFDVLQSPNRQHPMVLLQPQPRLQDFIPNFEFGSSSRGSSGLPNIDATYVGLIEDNGALFAMSPDHFPLVMFSQDNYKPGGRGRGRRVPTIDAPPGYIPGSEDGDPDAEPDFLDLPLDVDGVTRLRKEYERCSSGNWDRGCVVGKRPVAAAGQSRLSRLLPGRLAPEDVHSQDQQSQEDKPESKLEFSAGAAVGDGNFSRDRSSGGRTGQLGAGSEIGRQVQTLSGGAMALAIFLVGLWYLTRKIRLGKEHSMEGVTESGLAHRSAAPANPPNVSTVDESNSPNDHGNVHAVHDVVAAGPDPTPDAVVAGDARLPLTSDAHPDTIAVPLTPKTLRLDVAENGRSSDKPSGTDALEDAEGDEDSDREGDNLAAPGKKKGTRRRKRGKKNRGNANVNNDELAAEVKGAAEDGNEMKEGENESPMPAPVPGVMFSASTSVLPPTQQLVVSDEILGYGSHGTVVFRGSLQGRAVAVKRLLQDFVTLASREVNILQESDDHPNVIRYYYQEAQANFLYIALELCPASLADVVERPDVHREISNAFDPKRALLQITAGLRHLHALKIIHRDIKPQNILVSAAKRGAGAAAGHRMLISDFGLCKRLEVDQTSFLPTAYGAMAAGTAGWRSPEILRGEVKIDEPPGDDSTHSSRGSVGTATNGSPPSAKPTRLTKSVDIFALGCLFYYILTNSGHPFGDRYEREVNILKDAKSLSALESFGEEGLEAIDLITGMLNTEASKRPDTSTCLTHPFFWNPARRLAFLQDASDRFEIMCRDPREADLIELERGASNVVGNDWQSRLDRTFLENLGKFRKYDGKSVQDLMRALRNKVRFLPIIPQRLLTA